MPWKSSPPPVVNSKVLKAQKLDAKAAKKAAKGDPDGACEASKKADKAARKGGWV